MSAGKGRLYLDMDPGIDDALALAAALGAGEVAGVVTVAGNVSGEHTWQNARHILRRLGRTDVPVVPGSAAPLFQPLFTAGEIHGPQGLGDLEIERESLPETGAGWSWLAGRLEQEVTPVGLVATGPLSNVARMWCGYPQVFDHIGQLTVMGGSLSGGNVTSTAEFNFYVDPDAAEILARHVSGLHIVGLDVTERVGLSPQDLKDMVRLGPTGQFLAELLEYYRIRISHRGARSVLAIHDVLAVFGALHPEAVTWEKTPIRIVREGDLRGTVVADPRNTQRPVAAIAREIDEPRFREWFWESLRAAAWL